MIRTLRAIYTEQLDWIVTDRCKLYWTVWAVARLTGVRVAVFRPLPDTKRWLTRCLLPRLIDRLLVVSEFARTRLGAHGAPLDRVRILYNPVDVDDRRTAPSDHAGVSARLGILASAFVIGFEGRIGRGRGVDVLWEALQSLMMRAAHIRLPCVGDGAELPAWRRKAQASAIAVIGSNMRGICEAFAPDHSGLRVPPCDRRTLGCAINRLHDDRDLRRRFGFTGRHYARIHFAADRIAGDFIAAPEDLSTIDRASAQCARDLRAGTGASSSRSAWKAAG